jgi:HD-GYP domain-containing protein (c-di-GMP phosphodiesterase class II)
MQPVMVPNGAARRFSLVDQATALALVLKKEFGVPFTIFEAATGSRVGAANPAEAAVPPVELDPASVRDFGRDGQAAVMLQPTGWFQILLVVQEAGAPVLVAAGELPALTRTIAEIALEQERLQKWAQAVSDRLRQADQLLSRHRDDSSLEAQVKPAWEGLLRLDHLIRRLRIHKEPARNQKRILQAAWEILGVRTLVWVPQQADAPLLFQGEAALSAWECRQLATWLAQAPDLQTTGVLLCNEVQASSWGGRFPNIHNLLALPVSDQGPLGWLIGINKTDGMGRDEGRGMRDEVNRGRAHPSSLIPHPCSGRVIPFRRSDAALLTPFAALLDLHVRSFGRYRDVQELLVGLTRSLTAAIDAKDSYTFGHSERVARIAVELGRQLSLPEEELSDVFLAGLLHDIGKIGIRDAVLRKAEPLTPEEFDHVKEHVTIGYSILKDLHPIRHLLPGVRNHHERYDGRGYPDGLAGEEIPLLARILAVADSFDAMTTNRPYRDALPLARVEQILSEGAGTQWDRRVIEAFQACRHTVHGIRQRGVGESLRYALQDVLRTNDSSPAPNLIPS